MLAGENVDMMSEYMPLDSFQRIYIVDLCKSLCEVARKKVRDKGWRNVVVVEGDACTFVPPEGKAQLITFSYSLSSAILRPPPARSLCGRRMCAAHTAPCAAPPRAPQRPLTPVLGAAVIPPFHTAVDRAITYLDHTHGLLGVTDFYVPSRYDLPLRRMSWVRRFFWRCAPASAWRLLHMCGAPCVGVDWARRRAGRRSTQTTSTSGPSGGTTWTTACRACGR